jgi:hypothetical protein
MVEEVKGNLQLRQSLPYGAIREMAKIFGNADTWISKVVAGKQNGNPLIIKCALDISNLHCKNNEELIKILRKYDTN